MYVYMQVCRFISFIRLFEVGKEKALVQIKTKNNIFCGVKNAEKEEIFPSYSTSDGEKIKKIKKKAARNEKKNVKHSSQPKGYFFSFHFFHFILLRNQKNK